MNKISFGRMIPNAGYEARYRKDLTRLIDQLNKETKREIASLYDFEITKDAFPSLAKLMKWLRKKWYKAFEERAKEMARWLVERVGKRTKDEITNQLKKIGFIIPTPEYTKEEQKDISKMIEDNVKLIKSIPQRYLRQVQRVVKEAWLRGGDLEHIKKNIEKKIDKSVKNAERRAYLIAKDQMNKITQQWAIAEAKRYGAKAGGWIHVPGEFSSRETHIHMNGQRFDLETGLYDEAVKKCVFPAELPYCACQCEFFFE